MLLRRLLCSLSQNGLFIASYVFIHLSFSFACVVVYLFTWRVFLSDHSAAVVISYRLPLLLRQIYLLMAFSCGVNFGNTSYPATIVIFLSFYYLQQYRVKC